MKKSMLIAALIALGALAAEPAAAQEAAPLAAKGGLATVSMTATVVAINKDTREVTLQDETGKQATITAGPEVRNFAQIQVGDILDVSYTQAVAVSVTPNPSGTIGRTESLGIARADLGQKPGGTIERTVDLDGEVTALDKTTRMATLMGSQYAVTLKVADDVDLSNIKVGDTVHVRYVESLAISVNKH